MGLGGLAALGSLAVTNRTYRLSQQGQLTDRYTKAIEQLGDDKLDIQLGGLYALERLAVDSKRDHPTVVEVLSAFVRERTDSAGREKRMKAYFLGVSTSETPGEASQPAAPDALSRPPVGVQAALTILGRLPRRTGISRGDLSYTHLVGATLVQADFRGANLRSADLTLANFRGADLTETILSDSSPSHAQLENAKLVRAVLGGTDLTRAHLLGADLTGAKLPRADCSRAFFCGRFWPVQSSTKLT